MQWFFKEEIRSLGWYTTDLRRFVRTISSEIRHSDGPEILLAVADQLFTGDILEDSPCRVLVGKSRRQLR